jgi:putative FmdB family regulatory protein
MPYYDYECKKCGAKFEINRKFTDSEEKVACPICGDKECKHVFSGFSTFRSTGNSCAPSPTRRSFG